MARLGIVAVALSAGVLAPPISGRAAQERRADAEFLLEAYDRYRAMAESAPTRDVPWQYLGPTNVSGRATDVAVAETGGRRHIHVAFATGGVWSTDDGGASWRALFEHFPSTSIGDIAVAPSNGNVLWVGTGEANPFRASMPGVGVYKSTDGGRTFTHTGLTDTHTIARILIHPVNPDVVYVAAPGHAWTANEMRGVFKTTDGGESWTKILYKSPLTGAIDMVMDPRDPETLYAATWQRIRRKWSDPRVEPGFRESSIWKTTDGGQTWREAAAGLPAAEVRGRIGLDVARSRTNVLYAFLDNYEPGRAARDGERDGYGRPITEPRIKAAEVYRSDDRGASWTRVTTPSDFMTDHSGTYGWVFGQIRVDPTDADTFYTLGIGLHVSRDAGKTFTTLRGTHGDHHGLWIDPARPSTLYSANDGGFYISEDSGGSWRYAREPGGVQFYNVVLDPSTPAWAYGSIQDDGSRRGRVDARGGRDRIPAVEWVNAPGGEGTHHAIDPWNPHIVYSHGFYGNFTRTDVTTIPMARGALTAPTTPPVIVDRDTGERVGGTGEPGGRGAEAGPQPPAPAGRGGRGRGRARGVSVNIRPRPAPGQPELRAQWMAPIIASPHQAGRIYAGYQFVYRSTDRGDSWDRISPDLSSNDPARMLAKSSSAVPFQTITALAESPRRTGLLYAGTDDGKLHVTADDGRTWTELTANVPTAKWYSRIVSSMHADGTVYVTQRGREDDEFGVYVYKSTDFGRTFASLAANIPAGSVNVIREDPSNPGVLYLGTDFGAFITRSDGRSWEVLGGGLPSVQVSDLAYHPRDHLIVVSTYGRGMYALDARRLGR